MSESVQRQTCGTCRGWLEFSTDGNGYLITECPTCKRLPAATLVAPDPAPSEPVTTVHLRDLPHWLVAYRERLGISAEAVGRQCGVSSVTIRNVERGMFRAATRTCGRIQTGLGITIVDARAGDFRKPDPAPIFSPHEGPVASPPRPHGPITGRHRSRLISALANVEEAFAVLRTAVAEALS